MKIFDGNGTEVFAQYGWNSTSSYKSSSLQQIFFEDSRNITIQVSLTSQWSYVKISYGALKKPLNLGRENKFTACDVRLCPLYKTRDAPMLVMPVFVDTTTFKCFLQSIFFLLITGNETCKRKPNIGSSILVNLNHFKYQHVQKMLIWLLVKSFAIHIFVVG